MRVCGLIVVMVGCSVLPVAAQTALHHRRPAVTRAGPAPLVPAAPPPVAVIPPPDAAPPHPTAPPPPPAVHADAPGETSKIDNGLRLTFGDNRTDFNPATEQALQILAHTGIGSTTVIYNLYAHAAGGPEDTSTPRRLSLQRALAVRSALINAGIVSTRIYVHAMGSAGTDTGAPADRVDITLANLDLGPVAPAPAGAPTGTPTGAPSAASP